MSFATFSSSARSTKGDSSQKSSPRRASTTCTSAIAEGDALDVFPFGHQDLPATPLPRLAGQLSPDAVGDHEEAVRRLDTDDHGARSRDLAADEKLVHIAIEAHFHPGSWLVEPGLRGVSCLRGSSPSPSTSTRREGSPPGCRRREPRGDVRVAILRPAVRAPPCSPPTRCRGRLRPRRRNGRAAWLARPVRRSMAAPARRAR